MDTSSVKDLKLLMFCRFGRKGASSRVRSYQYVPLFISAGVRVTENYLLSDKYLDSLYAHKPIPLLNILGCLLRRFWYIATMFRYDVVWIEKELFPWLPSWTEYILAVCGVRYIVDYDDALFHLYENKTGIWARFFLHNKIDHIMRHAFYVIAGNDYLAKRAHRAGALRVVVIPSTVPVDEYSMKDHANTNKLPTIGWIGSPSTVSHLALAVPYLISLHVMYPFRLYVVGSEGKVLNTGNIPTIYQKWTEQTQSRHLQEFDIGIMPLIEGNWERGKCGYKLIQYMASGLPVVASAVGANKQIVEDGIDGFLVSSEQEWQDRLQELFRSPQLRQQMGSAGRKKVSKFYDINICFPDVLNVLRMASQKG
ncbi:MAG: glycosyltransferase family 4 protein [Parcubacteria group bacterium]|nr:glycosyltransferase family 4 protein [Parcubacteria group bacterium]